jgi:hypothetical protein
VRSNTPPTARRMLERAEGKTQKIISAKTAAN